MESLTTQQLEKLVRTGDPETLIKVEAYLDLQEATKAKLNFRHFVKLFWPIVSTAPLRPGWHIDAICEHLQQLPDLKRLLINCPARHGKSSLLVLFVAWSLANNSRLKFICSSYSLQLSLRDSIACRAVIESPRYQRMFGHHYRLRADQNTKSRFTTSKNGYRLATSTGSSTTGEGADFLIVDDGNNVATIHSKLERQAVIDWFTQTMSTRLNPGGQDCKVVIQQRCHEEDLSGYILANSDDSWTHLVLPYEYDPGRKTVTSIWSDPRTEPGQPLSDLLSETKIKELKGPTGLGPTGFATQFNQLPAPAEGNVFQQSWFKTFKETSDAYYLNDTKVAKELCRCFITTDLAVSLKTSADYTVAAVWKITPHNHLLLIDLYRDRVEGPDAIKAFKKLTETYKPDCLYVEDVGYQKIMLQLLRQQGLPVRPLQHMGMDKKSRAQRAIVKAECGQIWLPNTADWLEDCLQELTVFPNAAHDDITDAVSYSAIVSANYPTRDLPPEETPEEKQQRQEKQEEERRNRLLWE